MDDSRKISGCGCIFYVCIALASYTFLYTLFSSDSTSTKTSDVHNSWFDSSVYQVERYLKKSYLYDSDSYEGMEWSKVSKTSDGSYFVRHKFRAKNRFGAYVVENKVFYLDKNGNVVGMSNY